MKDLLLRARVFVRTFNVKITRHLADYVKNLIARKSVLHVQHDFVFFVQPMKSLICGADVAFPVAVS